MAGSVQGTIFKRTVLQEKNICFEPVLSFKEEDGAFSALFNLSTMNDFHNFLIQHLIKFCQKYLILLIKKIAGNQYQS